MRRRYIYLLILLSISAQPKNIGKYTVGPVDSMAEECSIRFTRHWQIDQWTRDKPVIGFTKNAGRWKPWEVE